KMSASLLKLSSVKGELAGEFVVDASGKGAPAVSLKLKAPEIDLGELLKTEDGVTAVEGPLAVDIALEGKGQSVAQILGTLKGHVGLLAQEGSADAKALDIFVGGLSAMFGTIFVEGSNKTKIECAICDLKFEKGVMTPQLAVLDTQYSTVFAEGKVDLKQEQLDLKVTPNAKGVTLSVAFPVLVKGTLSQPNVDVDKTGALIKAGELWATVVYPPAALVKFSDLGDGKENPCVSMVAEKAGIPIVEDVGKAVKGVVKGTGKVLEGTGGKIKEVGSGLGKLFGKDKQDTASPASEDEPGEAEPDDTDENLFEDY
ncbi:MAG: AsmA-like C-terminal region-containing protein, partial [Gammaproteobacteria bacterium]